MLVFEGLRVLEISGGVAAGFTGRLLRGFGADVRRFDVDRPLPLTGDEAIYLHSGKSEVSKTALPTAMTDADMILTDLQPHEAAAHGLDWQAARAESPRVLIVSVTPFGLSGPYCNFETTNAVSFAMGGIMSLTGDQDRTPLVTGGSQALYLAGLNAFSAAVTAWYGQRRHGGGELVEISAQECAAGMLELYGPVTSYGGPVLPRLGNHTRASWGIYPCLDGWAGVFALERQVHTLFRLMDDPDLREPRFVDPLLRMEQANEEELTAKLFVYFADKTKADLLALGLESRVPFGAAVTPAELLESEGLTVRGFFDPVNGIRMPGRPFPGFGWRSPAEPVPAVSADDERAPTTTVSADDTGRLPLAGIRVLDLTMMWAGPFATLRLADMGADVIKIESPTAWDNIRTLLPPPPGVVDPWNSAIYFNAYNRSKRSLTLDLAQPAGKELFLRLVRDADVVIENYRADVLDKLGLGYEVLRAANDDIVLVSMAAFGKEGPDRSFVGFGPVIELMSGLTSLSGYGDGEPFKTGISYGDPVAGTAAVAAAVMGLAQRDSTGAGCHVDLAQRETAAMLIGERFVAASSRGESPVALGCRDATIAPQGCYRCVGDDEWLVVSVRTDDEWRSVCDVIGRSDLSGLSLVERRARHDELDDSISRWTTTRLGQDAMEQLQDRDVPAGRVLNTGTVLDDPQLLRRGFWHYLPHPKMQRYRQQNVVWRLADAQPVPRRHSPLFGEHNREILQGELGITDPELEKLTADHVIGDAPINPGVG